MGDENILSDDLSGFGTLRRGTLGDLKCDARAIVDLAPARNRRGVSTPNLVSRSLIPPLITVVVATLLQRHKTESDRTVGFRLITRKYGRRRSKGSRGAPRL